jgi:hypothetical protein
MYETGRRISDQGKIEESMRLSSVCEGIGFPLHVDNCGSTKDGGTGRLNAVQGKETMDYIQTGLLEVEFPHCV